MTFLSLFRGVMTLAVFFSLVLMGRVYSRLSVVNASLVYPVNFFVVFGSLTFFLTSGSPHWASFPYGWYSRR